MTVPSTHQEVVFAKYRDEDTFKVSVSDTTFETILKRQGYKPVDRVPGYRVYEIPLNKLTIRKAGKRKKRVLSAETKAKLAENLKRARAARIK